MDNLKHTPAMLKKYIPRIALQRYVFTIAEIKKSYFKIWKNNFHLTNGYTLLPSSFFIASFVIYKHFPKLFSKH